MSLPTHPLLIDGIPIDRNPPPGFESRRAWRHWQNLERPRECPFCGEVYFLDIGHEHVGHVFGVKCTDCGIATKESPHLQTALGIWNHREGPAATVPLWMAKAVVADFLLVEMGERVPRMVGTETEIRFEYYARLGQWRWCILLPEWNLVGNDLSVEMEDTCWGTEDYTPEGYIWCDGHRPDGSTGPHVRRLEDVASIEELDPEQEMLGRRTRGHPVTGDDEEVRFDIAGQPLIMKRSCW